MWLGRFWALGEVLGAGIRQSHPLAWEGVARVVEVWRGGVGFAVAMR
jgi:hypothetical protein